MDDTSPASNEITALLDAWGGGDAAAFDRLFRELYPELRQIAGRAMRRERTAHTLQPTAVVHEVFLELAGQERSRFRDRGHFLGVAGLLMRRILVDHARSRAAAKRGSGHAAISVDALEEIAGELDAALSEEILAVDFALGISLATVKREWTAARAWLRRELATA